MTTRIEWTATQRPDGTWRPGYTWNPWWGCTEIGPECGRHAPAGTHGLCYAAVFASRGLIPAHRGTAVDGKWTGAITRSTPAVWAAPFSWPAANVFTCSMSDFWHADVPLPWLDEALDTIDRTSHLTYLMLTKRPGLVNRRLAELRRKLPRNVWIGTSIGHVQSLPLLKPLRAIDATLRFLSCEPLLTALPDMPLDGIGWVIAGGQSGRDAQPMHPDWARSLRDQCVAAKVPFFFKQWGEWLCGDDRGWPKSRGWRRFGTGDGDTFAAIRIGKARAGAILDGREWREMPANA